jgi:ABC-type transport system substrate-binding protein
VFFVSIALLIALDQRLEAYEDYWDPRYPRVSRIIFDSTLSLNRKEAMRRCTEEEGKVDIVSHIRPLNTLRVAESAFAKVVKSRNVTRLGAYMNQRKADSKWRDIHLRKALNYAINRNELLKYAAMGNAHDLGGFIPAGAYGHNPRLDLYKYDTLKARSLLKRAGYPEGFDVKIIVLEPFKLEAQIIGKMLERIGLRANLEVLSQLDWLQKIYLPLLDKPPEEQDWDIAIWRWPNHLGAALLERPWTTLFGIRYRDPFNEVLLI